MGWSNYRIFDESHQCEDSRLTVAMQPLLGSAGECISIERKLIEDVYLSQSISKEEVIA